MATPATAAASGNWPYSNQSINGSISNGNPSSLLRSPPTHATKALSGQGSGPGSFAGTGSSSNLSPPGTASSLTGGSASSTTSPSLGDIGNTLHSTLSSLSLNSGSTAASSNNTNNNSILNNSSYNAKSPNDYTRPLPLRTPSAGSLQHYQQQQQQQSAPVQISAIGSGRSGTSPPSRSNGIDGFNGSSSIGSPSSTNILSPSSNTSQQLPPPHLQSQGQRHTPSHNLPWPSYTNSSNNSSVANSLAFLSSGNEGSSAANGSFNTRSSIDGNFGSQANQFNQPHLRQHTNSDISTRSLHARPFQQEDQDHLLSGGGDAQHGSNANNDDNNTSSGFSLSSASQQQQQQSQFNLDHAQLAKSREQRDLDDVDSGQRASATLWMGDLEGWMDEHYIKKCITALGWDRDDNGTPQSVQTGVKMIKGASSTSGYCFITFPTSAHAQSVLAHFSKQPPMLMPGSERTFKLNWATGLPGVQPKWEGEYSIFVGDLGREVTEGELVALFTPLFQSTKSAKIMYDPATGLSRGYGFVRFGDENDMSRSLALGQNTSGSGLSLRGRTLRISEASGSGGSRNRTQSGEMESPVNGNGSNPAKSNRDLHIKVPGGNNMAASNLLSPNANGFSIPVSSPTSPHGMASPPYPTHGHGPNGGSGHSTPLSPSQDPTNTTVFVGGLPACISEDTLRSFFQHFGEITYVKIPPNKGCGFVQFLRRPDAELAIAKMHDFPIHGKSRIRLSWGRSQGDKQVEHVRKLASALNVPFEAVWRMVQGQDNSTIKQIASAVGGNGSARPGGMRNIPGTTSAADSDIARAGLARLASLRSSVGPGAGGPPQASLPKGPFNDMTVPRGGMYDGMQGFPPGVQQGGPGPQPFGPHDPEAYAFRPAVPAALSPTEFGYAGPPRGSDGGPYSRVSPSAFAPLSASGQPQQGQPLSPTSSGRAYTHQQEFAQPQHQHLSGYGGSFDPYSPVSIPSPVANESAHIQGHSGSGSAALSNFDGSSNFGPRSWRQQQQQQQHQSDISAPSPSFQSGLPEFLTGSTNGRF